MKPLTGRTAVVTGASRGAGHGIALAIGATGATVYVTARSVRGAAITENLPGTIDETAEAVTARGGEGIAVRCDHTVDSDVEHLFERVRRERARLDLLINSAWGGYKHHDHRIFSAPFYELGLEKVRESTKSRKFLLMVTDGDNHSRRSAAAVVHLATESNTQVYVVQIAEMFGRLPSAGPGNETGGRTFLVHDLRELEDACDKIA